MPTNWNEFEPEQPSSEETTTDWNEFTPVEWGDFSPVPENSSGIVASEAPKDDTLGEAVTKKVLNTADRWKGIGGGLLSMAGDDKGALESIAQPFNEAKKEGREPGFMDYYKSAFNAVTSGTLLSSLAKQSIDKDSIGGKFMNSMSETGRAIKADAQKELTENRVETDSLGVELAGDIVAGTIDMLPMLVAGRLGGTTAAGSVFGTQVAGQSYGESLEKGRTQAEALDAVKFDLFAEWLPEKFMVIDTLLKPGTSFFKRMVNATLGEGAQESLTEILQSAYDDVTLKDMSVKDAIQNIDWARVGKAGAVGAGVGASLSVPAHLTDRSSGDKPADTTSFDASSDVPQKFTPTHKARNGFVLQQVTAGGVPVPDQYWTAEGKRVTVKNAIPTPTEAAPATDSAFDVGPLDINTQADAIRDEVMGGKTGPVANQGIINSIYGGKVKPEEIVPRETPVTVDPAALANDQKIADIEKAAVTPTPEQLAAGAETASRPPTFSEQQETLTKLAESEGFELKDDSNQFVIDKLFGDMPAELIDHSKVNRLTQSAKAQQEINRIEAQLYEPDTSSSEAEYVETQPFGNEPETTSKKPLQNITKLKSVRAKLNKQKKEFNVKPADLLGTIANKGGINRKYAEGIDPAEMNIRKGGVRPVFPVNGGMSMDEMGELLFEHGFFQNERPEANEVIDLVGRAMAGEDIFTLSDMGDKAEADFELELIDNQIDQIDNLIEESTTYQQILKDDGAVAADKYLEELQIGKQHEAESESRYDYDYLEQEVETLDLDQEGQTYLELMERAEKVNPEGYEAVIDGLIDSDAELSVVASEMLKLIEGKKDETKPEKPEKTEEQTTDGGEAATSEKQGTEKTDRRKRSQQVEADQRTGSDRRKDQLAREKIKAMPREELEKMVLEHDLTGVKSRFAFDIENKEADVFASIDADSLKWVNDNMTPDNGDKLLQAVADALVGEFGYDRVYHISGDEFYVLGFSDTDSGILQEGMTRVDERLSRVKLKVSKDDGTKIELKGIAATAGHSDSKVGADNELKKLKQSKEEAGERAKRGEPATGAVITDAEGQSDRQDSVASDEGQASETQTDTGTDEEVKDAIDEAAHEAATSPENNLKEPSMAQKEAENYKNGDIPNELVNGLDIKIENPKGSYRFKIDIEKLTELAEKYKGIKTALTDLENSSKIPAAFKRLEAMSKSVSALNPVLDKGWYNEMKSHYGKFVGSMGADGDAVDVFLGENAHDESLPIFIIDQMNQFDKNRPFDEHKVMLGFKNVEDAFMGYHENYDEGWEGLGSISDLTIDEFKEWLAGDTTEPFADLLRQSKQDKLKAKSKKRTVTSAAPEHELVGIDDRELSEIVKEFNDYQEEMYEEEQLVTKVFFPPSKKEVVRLNNKVKVYHKDHGWMNPKDAAALVDTWEQNALDQSANDKIRNENGNKIVISLFDLSGAWSLPWEQAGYQVFRFDIQEGSTVENNEGEVINMGDIMNFSSEFFDDIFGGFDGKDIYAVLAACPCTDFAVSGARHFAAKDADGRTVASVNLVHQTLATIEYFKPQVWALENPVGRIEKLGGLPPWRLSFDPFHLGETYTKKTLIWGRFNADLPIAPVDPVEGSKMHTQYGGKSLKTKNARSVTPMGFAYGFFQANNAHDHPIIEVANKFDRLDRDLIQKALDAGITPADINEAVEDFYYQEMDDDAANNAIQELIKEKDDKYDEKPQGEVDLLGDNVSQEQAVADTKREKQEKLSGTKDVPMSAGEGDLFGDSDKQIDIEDQIKREEKSEDTNSVETGSKSVTEENLSRVEGNEEIAVSILDAANVSGKDRLDVISQFRKGEINIADLREAYPAEQKEPTKPEGDGRQAKAGGEWGINGEWYKGGQFMPASAFTVKGQYKVEKTGGGGRALIAPGQYAEMERGRINIFGSIKEHVDAIDDSKDAWTKDTKFKLKTREDFPWGSHFGNGLLEAQKRVDLYNNGVRFIDRDGYPVLPKHLNPESIDKDSEEGYKKVVNEPDASEKGFKGGPYTLQYHNSIIKGANAGTLSIDDFHKALNTLLDNKEEIITRLNKYTKPVLKNMAQRYYYHDEKKPKIVDDVYENLVEFYLLNNKVPQAEGFVIGGGGYAKLVEDAWNKTVDIAKGITQEDLVKWKEHRAEKVAEREKEKAEAEAAITDPETLEDFELFIRTKLHLDRELTFTEARMLLTPEQRAKYDELKGESTRDKRKARADQQRTTVMAAGDIGSANLVETKHTRDGYDLFVVVPSERVEKEDYRTWLETAKKLGGWYSRYRGQGATPGFQFKEKDAAETFLNYIVGGDTEGVKEKAQERRDAFTDDKSQSAVERLNEMADKLEERATDKLNAPRKTNTARRAGQAASAEAQANYDIAIANTMRNVASAIDAGTGKFLDRVRTKVQVEMLTQFISSAKNDQLTNKYPDWADREKHTGEPVDAETVEFAKYPTYTAYRSDLARMGRQFSEIDGMKKIGKDILKVADDVSAEYLKFAKENLNEVSTFTGKNGVKAVFKRKGDAEDAIIRSGYRGQAIVLPFKRGENLIILSPSESIKRGIWNGDNDKRISLDRSFVGNLVGKARYKNNVDIPYQFENSYEKLTRLSSMGIETPAEFRAVLREFIDLRQEQAKPDKVKEIERSMVGRVKDGLDFFPTPEATADEMVEVAGIEEGMDVLEPSAGWGHIAERIREAGVEPDVIEMGGKRADLLEAKGFNVVGNDFMQHKGKADGKPLSNDFLKKMEIIVKDIDKSKAKLAKINETQMKRIHDGSMSRATTTTSNARASSESDYLNNKKRELSEFIRVEMSGGVTIPQHILNAVGSSYEYNAEGNYDPIEQAGSGKYDRIVMNPPFSNGRDVDHVKHAYSLLKPGGRVVAIMGEHSFFAGDKKSKEFRDWLEEVGGSEEKLEEGTFQDANLPVNTGVNARMVVIDKAEPSFSQRSTDKVTAPPKGIDLKTAQAAIAEFKANHNGYPRGLDFKIYKDKKTAFGIDKVINLREKGTKYVKGAYYSNKGTVILITSDLNNLEDAVKTLQHEIIGHHGLNLFFKQDKQAIIDRIKDSRSERSMNKLWEDIDKHYTNQSEDIKAEELFASLAENKQGKLSKLWNDLVQMIRQFLINKGWITDKTSKGELQALINSISESIARGAQQTYYPAGDDVQFDSESDQPFYSQMQRILASKLPGKSTSASYKKIIQAYANKGDFKAEELEWSGVEEWLDSLGGKKITKSELLDFMTANQIQIEEVVKGGEGGRAPMAEIERIKNSLRLSGISVTIDTDGYIDGIKTPDGKRASFLNIEDEINPLFPEYDDFKGGIQDAPLDDSQLKTFLANAGIKSNKEIERDISDLFETINEARVNEDMGYNDPDVTAYEDQTLPGGENYTELLLTLPEKDYKEFMDEVEPLTELPLDEYDIVVDSAGDTDKYYVSRSDTSAGIPINGYHETKEKAVNSALGLINNQRKGVEADNAFRRQKNSTYSSGHWSEKNILAHVRYNERTDSDGKRVLFLEELQSDWHQDGRKKGYKTKNITPEYAKKLFEISDSDWSNMSNEDKNSYVDEIKEGGDHLKGLIPDAPFKTTWQMLAMKRMIRHAAENGFDRIAWTTGEQQNERYSLEKQITSIASGSRQDGKYSFQATKDGMIVMDKNVTKPEMADLVGDELTEKITSNKEVNAGFVTTFSGLDLKTGGEGMRGFYDNMLPNMVNKYVKKWGAKVSQSEIETGQAYESGIAIKGEKDVEEVHSLDITEKMRESVMEGQPLFSLKNNALREWMAFSRVKKVMYHATTADFETFDTDRGDLGAHFGTMEQANNVADFRLGGEPGSDIKIIPVWLNITNPLRLKDVGTFHADGIASQLARKKLITKAEARAMEKDIERDWKMRKVYDPQLLQVIREAGYDGVVYKNTAEHEGKGDSYIAFNPNQVKSAVGNRGSFDRDSDNILFSQRAGDNIPPFSPLLALEPVGESLGLPEESLKQRGIRLFQDAFNRVKTLQEEIVERGGIITEDSNVYRTEERSSGKIAAKLVELDRDYMKPFIADLKETGVSLQELDRFLIARHAQERNEWIAKHNSDMPDGGSGLLNSEAQEVLDEIEAQGLTGNYTVLANHVYAVNNKHLTTLVEGGHMKPADMVALQSRWKYYVPLKGKVGEEGRPVIGQGYSVSGSGIKKAMGRGIGNIAESPTSHAFAQAESAVVRTEKTKVGQALVRLMLDNPDPGFWSMSQRTFDKFIGADGEFFEGYEKPPEGLIDGTDYHRVMAFTPAEVELAAEEGRMPRKQVVYRLDPKYKYRDDVFSVMIEGEEYLINIKDNLVYEQLKKMNSNKLNSVVAAAGSVNRFLAMINTALNPEFVITNLERDFSTAMVNLSGEQSLVMAYKVAKNMPSAAHGIWQSVFDTKGSSPWRTEFEEMQLEGGAIGFFGLEDIQTKVKHIQSRLENTNTTLGHTKESIKLVRDTILDANLSVENAARLSAYKIAKEQYIKDGFSPAEARSKAASLSKNLTVNFNRKGELAPLLNSAFLFYNASIQGSFRIFSALKHKRVQKIVGGIAMSAFGLAMYNMMAGGDDEDGVSHWEKIPPYLKQTNIIFMHPDGSGEYTKVRLPYGYNVFHYTGTALHDLMFGKNTTVTGTAFNMASAILNAFSPISGADFLDTITPTVLKPFEQDVRNIRFTGTSIRPENPFDQYDRPESQKAFKSTDPILKQLMIDLNELTGGDPTHSGIIDVSPETVKHYIGWVSGGAGMFAGRVGTLASKAVSGEDIEARDIPFIRTVKGKVGPQYDTERFYSAIKEINATKALSKQLKGTDGYSDHRNKNRKIIALHLRLGKYKRRIKDLKDKRNRAYERGNKAQAKDYSEQIHSKMLEFLKEYDKARAE